MSCGTYTLPGCPSGENQHRLWSICSKQEQKTVLLFPINLGTLAPREPTWPGGCSCRGRRSPAEPAQWLAPWARWAWAPLSSEPGTEAGCRCSRRWSRPAAGGSRSCAALRGKKRGVIIDVQGFGSISWSTRGASMWSLVLMEHGKPSHKHVELQQTDQIWTLLY